MSKDSGDASRLDEGALVRFLSGNESGTLRIATPGGALVASEASGGADKGALVHHASWAGVELTVAALEACLSRHRPTNAVLEEWLANVRLDDLYLVAACVEGDATALRYLDERFLARIGATVRRIDGS